ncbi:efflux RND transporter periplasmic adaptor subunit [Neorhizobium sp. JUb45]|uniref:efflux RND transporter periplasmic adaptor subunit n=1 Tax=unclassified Neorhizobium TaxID=2629175 RepID=UPI00104A4DC4|nr:efflux RND transporter periplasmic adaptor subunit [Neorhizobium sp. JUb45]TCR02731.1 HlyD family secretion protein [Neorhizobium sp. JUb45]
MSHPGGFIHTASLAVVMAVTGMGTLAMAQEQPAVVASKLPAIVVTDVIERALTDRVLASGTIRPVDEVLVQPLVDGLPIKVIHADIGDRITAGTILATLDGDALVLQQSQYQANKAKAEAALAQARAQVVEAQASYDDTIRQRDRTKRLGQSGTSSVSQMEQATAQADVADAKLKAAAQAVIVAEAEIRVVDAQLADIELKLGRTDVRSPVSGIISIRNAKVGAIAAGSGDPLFNIIRNGAIELVADLPEADIGKIRRDQKATIRVAGNRTGIDGVVRLVSPTVDASTRLGAVHIVVDAISAARSGMFASAEIIVSQANVLALPQSAVTTGRDGPTVRKIAQTNGDNVVRQVSVAIGVQDSGFVEIVSGLVKGESVVAKAGAFVRDGDHIAPVNAPDHTQSAQPTN